MQIRYEKAGDEAAIFKLTADAFKPKKFSDGSEPVIIDRLRSDGDLFLSLVAVKEDEIVGHVAFSAVTIGGADNQWFGLGPVSVAIEHQRGGIGSKLIDAGLSQLKSSGANGCVLVGDPVYYSRFGFKNDGSVTYGNVPTQFVHWLLLDGALPSGEIKYCPAFDGG